MDSLRRDQHLQLVPRRQLHPLNVLGHALGNVAAEVGQVLPHQGVELAHSG